MTMTSAWWSKRSSPAEASNGRLRTFDDGDISSVDLGLTYDKHDVTGFGDAVHNVVQGQDAGPGDADVPHSYATGCC